MKEKMSRKSRENASRQEAKRVADDVEPVRIAARIAAAAATIEQTQRELRRLVVLARQARMSWTSIGEALGVSRQSARERYRDVDPVDGEHGVSASQLGRRISEGKGS